MSNTHSQIYIHSVLQLQNEDFFGLMEVLNGKEVIKNKDYKNYTCFIEIKRSGCQN